MKTNILRVLTATASVAGSFAALDLGGLISVFPPKTASVLGAVALAALAVKEIAVVIGDSLDDGKRNGSFR